MTGSLSPGKLVWSLPHIRSAVLQQLDEGQLFQLLTLNYESFPQVVQALYRDMKWYKWRKFLMAGGSQLWHSSPVS